MKKYVRISLVLTCICLICALAVAGVNYITAPIIEKNAVAAKMEAYKEIFPDLDEEASGFTSEGFESAYVKEKLEAKNANDELLGYAFNASGKNTYGPITLVVGFDTEYNLIKVKLTENGQTGGRNDMINEWIGSFTGGMTPTEIQNVPTKSGATIGSKLVKDILNGCLGELGIKTPIQEKLEKYFPDVNMDKSKADNLVHYANQLGLSYTVKNKSDELLGYYFEYKTEFEVLEIALDQDMNYLPNVVVEDETLKALILEVVKAEITNSFSEELAIKVMFGAGVTAEEQKVDNVPADADIKTYKKLKKDNKDVGSYVISKRENTYGYVELLVGINADKTLNSVFIVDATQTIGKNAQLSEFINRFDGGMNGLDCMGVDVVAGATFASKTAKEVIADAFEIITGERPQLGYDEQYQSLFEDVDLSKSKAIEKFSEPTKDGKFVEGKELYSTNGKLLGYGFVLESTKNSLDGTLTVIVGVQTNGKLQKAIIVANGQTGGFGDKLNGYEDKFTPGMGTSDVDNVANSGATLGSLQFKALVIMAMKEVGSYEEFYKLGFEEMTKFTPKEKISNNAIIEGVDVFKDETKLGSAYIVRVENVFSWHIFMVALDNDGKLVKVVDVDNFHPGDGEKADITEHLNKFTKGMTFEEVDKMNVFDQHATYTLEQIKLGIKIAMIENGYKNSEVDHEINVKKVFPNAVWDKSEALDINSDKGIIYGYKVWSSEFNPDYSFKGFVGYAYFVEVENDDIILKLMVGLDNNGNLVKAVLIDMETKSVIDPNPKVFGDTLKSRIEQYLATFTAGMNEYAVKSAPYLEGAGYASQLIKYAIRLTMNNDIKKEVYNNEEFYLNNIEGISLMNSVSIMNEVTDEHIIDAILAKDRNGKEIAKAYIVDLLGIYSHNYVLVVLNMDGTLNKIYDVENNHGSLSSIYKFFTNGLKYEEVSNISIHPDPTSHSSYTIEQAKLAVKIAMKASGLNDELRYEIAAKILYPFMVQDRSDVVKTLNSDIKFGQKVRGTDLSIYTDGVLLGFVFVLEQDGLEAMIAIDKQGNYNGAEVLAGDKEAFKDIAKGLSLEEIEKLADSTVRSMIIAAIKESYNHFELTNYDKQIIEALPNYYAKLSKIEDKKNYKFEETELIAKLMDKTGKQIGTLVVNKIENVYSWHRFGVILDTDKRLIKVFNIEGYHPGDKDDPNPNIDEHLKNFKPGMDFEAISKVGLDANSHSTYTVEQVRLGIKLAMKELMTIDDKFNDVVFFEKALKMTFKAAVWDKSKEIKTDNPNILYASEVHGTTLDPYKDGALLGYAYIVRVENGYSWHIFGVALDTNGKLIQVVDIDNYHPSDGEKADISDKLAIFKKGMSLSQVEKIKYDAVGHATFTIEQIRLGIKIAMSTHLDKFNDNLNSEIALKEIFNNAVWDLSKVLSDFSNSAIKAGYKVWSSELDGTTFQPLGFIGYAYIIELNGKKAMIGVDNSNAVKGVYDMNTKELVSDTASYQALIDIALAEGGNK